MSYQRNMFCFNMLQIFRAVLVRCNRLQYSMQRGRALAVAGLVAGLLFAGSVVWAEEEDAHTVVLYPRSARTNVLSRTKSVAMPFYVHNSALNPPPRNFAASGFMGDVSDLRVMGSYTKLLKKGVPCIKVVYTGKGASGWAGLAWQNPADNWGDKARGGYNLSKATHLVFWACGEKGGEVVEFKLGGAAGLYPDSTTLTIGSITLTPNWVRYVIDLQGEDLHYISTGFGFVVNTMDNPEGCTFYIDEVAYFD
ncbi:MAG: hypothetical protein BWY59_02541 [Verrucomicrobia bacterium ADurb.Bin345]|nr:MAG: hypothetical protein BWY59_02541 [Verrucomicrobia bacterium ADurb.Bin345]